MSRPWLIFVGAVAFIVGLFEWRDEFFNRRLPEWTAQQFAWLLSRLGENGRAEGTMVYSSACSFEIVGECTAYYPAAIFVAAVLAFPSTWRAKLLGVGVGMPAIFFLNMVRLLTLCYVNRSFPASFETVHVLVWQSLLIFLVLMLWLLWVAVLVRRGTSHAT